MKINPEELTGALKGLTGRDFEAAEKAERGIGNSTPIISFSPGFQVRLAAAALKVNPNDIKDLPINQYNLAATTVSNFLFSDSESETENSNHETPSMK